MQLELIKISKIKINPKNPRLIKDEEFDKLKQSLRDFPQMLEVRPVVLDDDDMILGGDKRLAAWKDLGNKEIKILRFSGLTEKQKRKFILLDNHHSGDWDMDILATDWDDEELEEFGLTPEFDTSEPMEKKKLTTVAFNKVHVLLSFAPDKLLEIQDLLNQLQNVEGVEYEQAAN